MITNIKEIGFETLIENFEEGTKKRRNRGR